MAIKMHPSLAIPASEWLKEEIIEPAHIPLGKLAKNLSISRQTLSAILNGRVRLTSKIAVRFEKAFGIKADTLVRMQSTYDIAQARKEEEKTFVPSMSSFLENDHRNHIR